jgi:DNA-binding NarL/FixJ family response regulator
LRDQVKVGLQQFMEFRVTCGESFPGVNMLRTVHFDIVFLELGENTRDCLTLIRHLRSFDRSTEVVALADGRVIRDLGREKQRHGINAFLHKPLEVAEFFRLVARLRARREEVEAAR